MGYVCDINETETLQGITIFTSTVFSCLNLELTGGNVRLGVGYKPIHTVLHCTDMGICA